jgi:PleD family two-component response regulator
MRATAFVVGPADGPGAALRDLAQGLGFAHVLAFDNLGRSEQQLQHTPVCFFLFAAVEDLSGLRTVAHQVRFSTSRRIRFSPLIYFSESASVETIRSCVDMGFDDVITVPFSRDRVMGRLEHQLNRNLVFFETANYVGPDRRTTPRAQTGQYRRIEISRSLHTGITVIKDRAHAAA